MNRIKKVSRVAKIAAFGFLIFAAFFTTRIFIFQSLPEFFERTFGEAKIIASNDTLHSPLLSCFSIVSFIYQVLLCFWYWKLFRLFSLYENGLIFGAEAIRCIKMLGALCAIGWVLLLIAHILPHPLLPSQIVPPPGVTVGVVATHTYRMGFFNFDFGTGIDFGLLLAGIVIALIAWIMDEGRKIQEEQELTV